MVKFNLKKKVAKALVFAMVMGTVGVHGMSMKSPVAVMAAAIDDITSSTTSVEKGKSLTLACNYVVGTDDVSAVTWAAKDNLPSGVTLVGNVLTIAADTTATSVTLTVTVTKTNADTGTKEITVTITEPEEESPDPTTGATAVGVTVDYSTYTATITATNDDLYVFLEVLKKKGDAYTVSATHSYEVGTVTVDGNTVKGVEVDLSFLKANADQYIKVYGSKEMKESEAYKAANPTKINKQLDKLSIKYKYTGAKTFAENLTVKSGKTQVTTEKFVENMSDANFNHYMYRSLYSSEWLPLKDFKWESAMIAGTTIIVREQSKDAPASAEVKVKIPAIAKAPKVAVDYVKGTIKLTDKMEYAVVTTSMGDWKAATKTPAISTLEGYSADGFTIAVRTAATSTKPASAMTFVSISKAPVLGDPASGKVAVDANTYLEYTSANEGKGIMLTATGAAFEYNNGTSWKTIKASSSVTLKDKTSVKVRLSGVKDSKDAKGEVVPGHFASNEQTVSVAAEAPSDPSVTIKEVTLNATNSGNATVKLEATVTGVEGDDAAVTWSVVSAKASSDANADDVLGTESARNVTIETSGTDNILTVKGTANSEGVVIVVKATIPSGEHDEYTITVAAALAEDGD